MMTVTKSGLVFSVPVYSLINLDQIIFTTVLVSGEAERVKA